MKKYSIEGALAASALSASLLATPTVANAQRSVESGPYSISIDCSDLSKSTLTLLETNSVFELPNDYGGLDYVIRQASRDPFHPAGLNNLAETLNRCQDRLSVSIHNPYVSAACETDSSICVFDKNWFWWDNVDPLQPPGEPLSHYLLS